MRWARAENGRAGEETINVRINKIRLPAGKKQDTLWRFSPDCTSLLGSPLLSGLLDFGTPASEMSGATASWFLPVQKTPSSGDSNSPFSLTVKRASQSSARFRALCTQQGLGSSYRYDSTLISGGSWPECVSNGTRSGLTRIGNRPLKMMHPVLECLEIMSLSPRPGDDDYDGNGMSAPLPELSF